MKKLITIACLFCAGFAFSQKLEKGNVVGYHVGTIHLNPDVTYNQFKSFFLTKYIPEINKAFMGDMVVYLAEGERGSEINGISYIYVFKSVETRNKYFPTPEKQTELFTSLMEKLKPLNDQLAKMGAYHEKFYTDWVVQ